MKCPSPLGVGPSSPTLASIAEVQNRHHGLGGPARGVVALGDLAAPTLVLGTHSEVRGRNADPARHVVGLASDDLDGDWKRLTAAGVD